METHADDVKEVDAETNAPAGNFENSTYMQNIMAR